jgi:hypothetical protein
MESDDEDAALLSQLISSQTHGESSQVTLLTLSIDLILVVIFLSFFPRTLTLLMPSLKVASKLKKFKH